ncbi:uncharacterized protein [Periplaneta americana]|uniref:uncharacterized protein isoform X2 n=1 Tax=Periplaneta americana TaxID=6978 RepID=UPI0037E81168
MKAVLAIMLLYLALVNGEAAINEKCRQQSGISRDTLKDLENERMLLGDESDEGGRCYIECMMKEMKIIKSGELNEEQLIKAIEFDLQQRGRVMNSEKIKAFLSDCRSKGKDSSGKCMKSYKTWKCIMQGVDSL